MALLWMDGFDHYDQNIVDASTKLAKVYTVENSSIILCSTGRYGGQAAYFAPGKYGVTKIYKSIVPNVGATHLIAGWNLNIVGDNRGTYIHSGNSANGISVIGSTLKCGSNVVATLASGWNHIEVRIPITTSGSNKYELYLNGATVFSSSSLSFVWTNVIHIGASYEYNSQGYYFAIDDLYIMDDTGSTNNARLSTELYVPRIETHFPVNDTTNDFTLSYTPITSVTYGFEDLGTPSNATAIFNGISTNLGLTNLSHEGTSGTFFRTDAGQGVGSSKSLTLRCWGSGGIPTTSIQFSCIASTLSFWYRDNSVSDSTTFSITINGVQTFLATTTTYQQYTVTLNPDVVNIIKLSTTSNDNRFTHLDDFQVTYTSKNAAQALYKVPETLSYIQSATNGQKIIGNIGNLKTINNVKAVGFCPIASEAVTAVTSSYKLLLNNGGSDTEIGSTQSVTGTTTVRSVQFFDINPLTSTAWTSSDFNAIKAGVINKT